VRSLREEIFKFYTLASFHKKWFRLQIEFPLNPILSKKGTKLGAGGNGEVSSAVNMKGEVIAIKRSLKQLKDEIKGR
jgi:hypothetical protein